MYSVGGRTVGGSWYLFDASFRRAPTDAAATCETNRRFLTNAGRRLHTRCEVGGRSAFIRGSDPWPA